MSPLHLLAPPGPPQHFRAQVMSDTNITLFWDNYVGLLVPAIYDICFNASTPVCVGGPVSILQYDMQYIKILSTLGIDN